MEFDFTVKKPLSQPIVLMVSLDKARHKERVIIAETDYLLSRRGVVYYDETKPLGNFLVHFESDAGSQWNLCVMDLYQSYGKIFRQWSDAETAAEFLRGKFEEGNASAKYAALRIWNEYLLCLYDRNQDKKAFQYTAQLLTRPFQHYLHHKPWDKLPDDIINRSLSIEDSRISLLYPYARQKAEYAVVQNSLQPLLYYYMRRLADWGLRFRQCKVCGKYFLAESQKYMICSAKCRKIQGKDNKRRFDERLQNDTMGKYYESAYNYWYNRLRKLKKTDDENALLQAKDAFDAFRAEAAQKKKGLASGSISQAEFGTWLEEQKDIIDKIMDESKNGA